MRIQRIGLAAMKGTAHLTLPALELAPAGPVGDRVFCLVDTGSGAVVRTKHHPELLKVSAHWDGGELTLRLPDGEVVADRPRAAAPAAAYEYWGRHPQLVVQDSPLSAVLSRVIDRDVRLARTTEPGDVVYGAPLTVVTTSELADLARRAGVGALDDARFRATLTLDDADAPGSLAPGDRLRMGDAEIEIGGRVPRCVLIDHDPATGARDASLLATLAGYRRTSEGLLFGHYARVRTPGAVERNAPVTSRR